MKKEARSAPLDEQVELVVNYMRTKEGIVRAKKITKDLGFPWHQNCYPTRVAILEAVNRGYPICSNPKGFYWGGRSEALDYAKRLRRRANKVLKRARALEQFAFQEAA